jgi:hypothetical protein
MHEFAACGRATLVDWRPSARRQPLRKRTVKFAVSSDLELGPEDVSGLLTMKGVNRELGPFVRMTAPPEWSDRAIFEWPTGQVLFSSWILLFGIVPVDRHAFCLQNVDRRRGFAEASSSWINRVWRHHRTFDNDGAFYRVTDTVEFQCRLPLLTCVLAPVYRFVFEHRHRVLRSYFGSRAS